MDTNLGINDIKKYKIYKRQLNESRYIYLNDCFHEILDTDIFVEEKTNRHREVELNIENNTEVL